LNPIELYNGIVAQLDPLKPVTPVSLFNFSIGRYNIMVSNHMFMVTLAAAILLLITLTIRPKDFVLKGMGNLIESVCVFLRDQMAKPVLGEFTDQYIYFVWTIFFFILCLNLLSMIPLESIIYLVSGKPNHFGGSATANIWITGGLAVTTFFVTHIAGIKKQGLWHYIANLAPPVPWPIIPIIYPLEIITALVRPFALAIRLFANMLAGHMVLATFLGLILVFKSYGAAFVSVIATVAISFLELLVAFVQAYIFAFLSTLFISFSIAPEH
jgi:F-type H+-transporting ATPase subunit a